MGQILYIVELTDFKDHLKRDVIIDNLSRPVVPTDAEFLPKVLAYGNIYLMRAMANPIYKDNIIWFDINFGDPAMIGMTWAYNPKAQTHTANLGYFWSIWSETDKAEGLDTLEEAQHKLGEYFLQEPPT